MGRSVKCQHCGERADRDLCVLVARSTGGSYRQAPRMQGTLISVDCATGLLGYAQGHPGETISRWSVRGLRRMLIDARRRDVGHPGLIADALDRYADRVELYRERRAG